MTVAVEYYTMILLQTALILQGVNALWSSGQRQQYTQQDCCRTDNYIGLVPPTPPSHDRYRYEGFQSYPRKYREGYHNKYNQFNDYNRRYLSSKHSPYSKDYYRKGPSLIPSYMQRRAGSSFADDHYSKRPYTKAENGFNFRNPQINYRPYSDTTYNDREVQNNKHSLGLLLSSVADRSGTIVVTDPDGIKHRINSVSLKELEQPENIKPFDFATGINDHVKDALDSSKTFHNFPDEFEIPSSTDSFQQNGYAYPNEKVADIIHYNGSFPENSQKERVQNNGYVSSSAIRFPSDVKDFRPSPPFHKYSEPDPLFHPNGSPLQTHSSQFITSPPAIATTFPMPRRQQPAYPDSINAQLPPTNNNENTHIPYLTAQHTKSSPATQATEATQKKVTQISPTKPSLFSTSGNEKISSTTQPPTGEDQKKWNFLPTVKAGSSSPIPQALNDNGFNIPCISSTESPTYITTPTAITTETSESKIPPSVSNLNNDAIVYSSTGFIKSDISETVENNYEATTETQVFSKQNVNATVSHIAIATVEPYFQTDSHSTASILALDTNAQVTENITKLEDYYFNTMTTPMVNEESATTTVPNDPHSY